MSQPAYHIGPNAKLNKLPETMTVRRSSMPAMPLFDFGTANYATPTKGKGLFGFSLKDPYTPYGRLKDAPEPNKFSKSGADVVNINPLALLVVASSFAMPVFAGVSIFFTAPGSQLPFNFLDDFYPPRVAEKARVKEKVKIVEDRIAAEKKAAADKKAEMEKAAEKAAKEEADKKAAAAQAVAAPKVVPKPAAKPAPPKPVAKKEVPKPAPVKARAAPAGMQSPKVKTNYCANCPQPIQPVPK